MNSLYNISENILTAFFVFCQSETKIVTPDLFMCA